VRAPDFSAALRVLLELFDRPMVLLRGRDVVWANQLAVPLLGSRPGREALGTQPWRFIDAELEAADGLTFAIRETPRAEPMLARLGTQWGLTPREGQVLALLAEGSSNKDIANGLECSERTVEVHVSRLLLKSRTSKRTELLARCWAHGVEG
jgi:DNA-binding NarL/FixJ family response regulator